MNSAARAGEVRVQLCRAVRQMEDAVGELRKAEGFLLDDSEAFPDGSAQYDRVRVREVIGALQVATRDALTMQYTWSAYARERARR